MWHMLCSFPTSQCPLSWWPNSNSVDLITGFPGGVVVQSPSHVQLFVTPWTTAHQASLCFTIFRNLLKLMSIDLVMTSNHLILCHSLLLPSIFPSIKVLSNESAIHISWPKYWSFSFSVSLSNEYSGLISFKIDWFDLLAIQRALKSLLQYHTLKVSIFQCSAFFYSPTLTSIHDYWKKQLWLYGRLSAKWCLCFSIYYLFVIAFLPRNKYLLIS